MKSISETTYNLTLKNHITSIRSCCLYDYYNYKNKIGTRAEGMVELPTFAQEYFYQEMLAVLSEGR